MTDEDFNLDLPLIRFRRRDGFHPAMKKIRDERAMSGRPQIEPTAKALSAQERLRAQAAYGPNWDTVEILSKTAATVGGTLVTLDRTTGTLSCPMHRGRDGCWHIRRLLEVARPRRRP